MANRWLAANLIRSLKLRGLLSSSNTRFSSDDFLFLLDETLRLDVVTSLMRINNGDYLTQYLDFAITTSPTRIRIPPRAASEQLELIQMSDGNGGWVPVDDIARRLNGISSQGLSLYYQLDDDGLLIPATLPGSTLRVYYRARPGRLVGDTAVGQVTAISTSGKTVTVTAVPTTVTGSGSTFTSVAFSTSLLYDFVAGAPGFRCLAVDMVCTNITGLVMTFSTAPPASLAVGDYVCIAGEAPIAQVPEGAHPLVSLHGLLIAERAMGNAERVAAAERAVAKGEANLITLLSKQKGATLSPLINPFAKGWRRFRGRRWWPR